MSKADIVELTEKTNKLLNELKEANKKFEDQFNQLAQLHRITNILQTAKGLSQVICMTLAAATAGTGYGFNRAMFFQVDKAENKVKGEMGVGPTTGEEANKIWKGVKENQMTLEDYMARAENAVMKYNIEMNKLVRSLSFDLNDIDRAVVRTVIERRPFKVLKTYCEPPDLELLKILKIDEFLTFPLISRDEVFGVLLVDNFVTRQPITDQDVKLLGIFCNQVSLAIENAVLHQEQQEQIIRLAKAYTELKTTQEKLIKSEKLAVLGQVAAVISHEIKTPLVSIGGYARRLNKLEQDDPVKKQITEIIYKEVERLENIIRGTLDLAKDQKGPVESVDVHSCIDSALNFIEVDLFNANIELKKEYQEDLPNAKINQDQLRQVLLNILRNAINSMPKGGKLTVKTKLDNKRIRISISDTGHGISKAHMDKLFTPFFSTKKGGTGLGLPICHKIMADYGGSIDVESEEGKGSTFTINLPIYTVNDE